MTEENQEQQYTRRQLLQLVGIAGAGAAVIGPAVLLTSGRDEPDLNLEREVHALLEQRGISRDISLIELTCVDPKYPATSLAKVEPRVKKNNVSYDGQHVLHAKGWKTADLIYQRGKELALPHSAVAAKLGDGVVQIAYKDGAMVIGMIGDTSALRKDGTGCAFGTHNAPPKVARATLAALLTYSEARPGSIEIVAMKHPDCGGYAWGTGREEHADVGRLVAPDGSNFMKSKFREFERRDKENGFQQLQVIAQHYGMGHVVSGIPDYQQRRPGIVGALAAHKAGNVHGG